MTAWDDTAKELAAMPAEQREARLEALRKQAILRAPAENVTKPPPVFSLRDYLEHEIESPPAVVGPKQVLRGGITTLVARTGAGKTTITLNRLVRWAAGRPMFDELPDTMVPERPVRSLVIENEGVPAEFQGALRKIVAHLGDAELIEAAKDNILIWGEGGLPRVKMDDPAHVDQVRAAIEKYTPDLVLMEPLRTLWKGEENSPTEAANLMDKVADIAVQYNIGVYMIHHMRKSGVGDAEGASYNEALRGGGPFGDYTSVIEFWRKLNDTDSELGWSKSRYYTQGGPVQMRWDPSVWGYTPVLPEAQEARVLEWLREAEGGWVSVRDAQDELELTDQKARKLLNALKDNPHVKTMRDHAGGHGSTGMLYRYEASEDEGTLRI